MPGSRARISLAALWGLLLSLVLVTAVAPSASAAPVTSNLPTMNISFNDPVASHNSLSYVHASKDNIAITKVGIEDSAGTYNLAAAAAEMKGRGNYTWNLPKKPYQIKFTNSVSILGMPAAKTWVLLANDADGSLMRNKVALDFAGAIGLAFSSESRWVDLRVDGQYLGNYQVTEKVEVKKNRVELNSNQGVITELDNNYGYAEDYKFNSVTTKTTYTLKDAKAGVPDKTVAPLPADTAAGWADMQSTINSLDAMLNSPNPDWAKLSAMIDIPSFVKYYFVYELTENPEIVASSVFFYKDGPSSKLYAGPVWDFDSSLGTYDHTESLGAFTNAEYVKNADQLRLRGNTAWYRHLFRMPEFVAAANTAWTSQGIGYEMSQLPAKIATYKSQIAASAANNFQRWKVLGTPTHLVAGEGRAYSSTYDGEVSYLSNWVTARYNNLKRAYGDVPLLRYEANSQSVGWLPKVDNGQIGGTVNSALVLYGLNYVLSGTTVAGGLSANGHVSNIGWMGYKSGSIGAVGSGKPLEAFQMRLTGDLANKYDVSYRAHVRNVGWQPWVTNGATAGTTGQAAPIEAVMIRLLAKNPPNPTPGPSTSVSPSPSPSVSKSASPSPSASVSPTAAGTAYSAHVATIGWMPTVTNDAVAGTTGRALAMEALMLKITNPGYSGGISYRGHVSSIGWQPWVTESSMIGTTGKALKLEAMQITLTGDLAAHYRIEYRAHVSGIGWQPYVADGATAGTTGQARAIEAVQIRLVPKS